MLVAVVLLLTLSIIAQLVAAIQALRLMAVTGRRLVWFVFLASVLLMLVNRVWALYDLYAYARPPSWVLLASASAMFAVSLTMAIGMHIIDPIFRDLFEAQENLLRERDLANSLIERSPTFFVAIDKQGNTKMINGAMLDSLGYTSEEVIGRPYLDMFVPPEDHERLAPLFKDLSNGIAIPMVRNVVLTRTGEPRVVEWYGSLVKGSSGDLDYFFGVGMDRTDVEALEEQLRQVQKMEAIGRLSGGIAHDFNNILTTIQGHAERLAKVHARDSEGHLSAIRILEASRTAADFTRQLLVFSRKQVSEAAVFSPNALVKDMHPLLERTLGDDILLDYDLTTDVSNVKAERSNLEQVVLNLAVNARDAMPKGGRLNIATSNFRPDSEEAYRTLDLAPGNYVRLSVTDTGVGISDDVRRQLFEPFFTTKEESEGTGIGLALVYGIVRGLGGAVHVESKPREGARFDVYLPATNQEATERPALVAHQVPGGQGETVLVVEDNDGVRELTCVILDGAGYRVVEADSPAQALALTQTMSKPPDLLLTDVVMPGMSGRDLAEKLCRTHPRMQVLYMSGYANSVLSEHTDLPVGMRYVQKPYQTDELLAAVHDALSSALFAQKE